MRTGSPETTCAARCSGSGSTYRTLGRDDDSERIFRRGLEEFPDFRPYRVFRAMLQYNRGEAREAVRELITVLLETTSDPDDRALPARARRLLGRSRPQLAELSAGAAGVPSAAPALVARPTVEA